MKKEERDMSRYCENNFKKRKKKKRDYFF